MLDTGIAQPAQFPWTALIGVLGTLAGFGLNECFNFLRRRREDRRPVGQALAELLEIWQRIRVVPAGMQLLRNKVPAPIPAEAEFHLRAFFRSLIPGFDAVQERYNAAITALAGTFPTLAFELRSKDILTPLLNQFHALVQQGGISAFAQFVRLEDGLINSVLPVLEQLIREAAAVHGKETRREVEIILKKQLDLPSGFDELISRFIVEAKQSAQQQQDAAGPPTPEGSQPRT